MTKEVSSWDIARMDRALSRWRITDGAFCGLLGIQEAVLGAWRRKGKVPAHARAVLDILSYLDAAQQLAPFLLSRSSTSTVSSREGVQSLNKSDSEPKRQIVLVDRPNQSELIKQKLED